jgi:energy-coupling factor transporter ATP-binding protein EcfA2
LELVYLWVEEYKNIHKQGFNFSPRFECKFHDEYDEDGNLKDDCKLEIKSKEHIENFFGDNINVTAIVGKNGSGKSSVLEAIFKNDILDKEIILVFKKEKKYLIYKNDISLQVNLSHEKYDIQQLEGIRDKDLFFIYHSSNFTNGILDSELELFATGVHELQPESDDPLYRKNQNIKTRVQTLLNLVFNSNRVITIHPTSSRYIDKNAFTISDMLNNYEMAKIIILLKFINTFGKEVLPFKITNDEKIKISIVENKHTKELFEKKLPFIDLVKEFIDKDNLEREEVGFSSNRDTSQINQRRLEDYIPIKEKIISFLKDKIPIHTEARAMIELTLENSLELLEIYLQLFRINENFPTPLFHWKFKHLSSGEESFVLMFALLFNGILTFSEGKNINSNVVIMLDEIENNLHPAWQKKIVGYIVEFLEKIIHVFQVDYNHKINFTLLLSSHSPFLLSDIPKQNIIFLDKDEKGNCKVVDGLKEKKQTFGANIHTLLSDSFFMEDGLMGEFAKGKINEIIEFHKEVEENKKEKSNCFSLRRRYLRLKTKFWQTQSIIGEDYLKQVIRNHLVEIEKILLGKDMAKKEEIARTKEYLKSLEDE